MKKCLLMVFIVVVSACSDQSGEVVSSEVKKNIQLKLQSSEVLTPLGDPCQLSGDDVAMVLGLEGHSEGLANAINNANLKACDYGSNNGGFQVLFERFNDKVIERKYLEKSFQMGLDDQSGKSKTQSIDEGLGDQAIFTVDKNGPNHTYSLRWRIGNHTQKLLRFSASSPQDEQLKLQQLKTIASKLVSH